MSEHVDAMRKAMDTWIAEGTEESWQAYRMACDAYLDSEEYQAYRKRMGGSGVTSNSEEE